jgi:hypothetical protein
MEGLMSAEPDPSLFAGSNPHLAGRLQIPEIVTVQR